MMACWRHNTWTPSAWFLAEMTHVLAGLFIWPAVHAGLHPLTAFLILVAWAIVKEFVLDLFIMEHDTISGSGEDALAYLIGGIANVLMFSHFYFGLALFVLVILALFLNDWQVQRATVLR
jgi:hypothetical protein